MASGDVSHFDDKPGSKQELEKLYRDQPSVRAFLREAHKLDHKHDIPYIGGISTDGKTVYLDRHVPLEIGDLPVAKLIILHETIEYAIIRELSRAKHDKFWFDHAHKYYEQAHHLATAAEDLMLTGEGLKWKTYTEALRPYYKPVEDEKLENPPKDIALYPYTGHLYQLLWDFRKGKVSKSFVNYRRGRAQESCGNCSMFLRSSHGCTLVAGVIVSSDVCDKWTAKT